MTVAEDCDVYIGPGGEGHGVCRTSMCPVAAAVDAGWGTQIQYMAFGEPYGAYLIILCNNPCFC